MRHVLTFPIGSFLLFTALLVGCSANKDSGPTITYTIEVLSDASGLGISAADVSLSTQGLQSPVSGYTDSKGIALLIIPAEFSGHIGRLKVVAEGFDPYAKYVLIPRESLPDQVRLSAKTASQEPTLTTDSQTPAPQTTTSEMPTQGPPTSTVEISTTEAPTPSESAGATATPTAMIFTNATPTEVIPEVGYSIEAYIDEGDTESFFDGELRISVIEANSYENEVTAVISSPGFVEAKVLGKEPGFKFTYPTSRRYEILTLGFGGTFFGSAQFQVTDLGPSDYESMLARPSEVLLIRKGQSGGVSFGELDITVQGAVKYENRISMVANSPGHDSVTQVDEGIGFIFQYQGDKRYEILFSGFGGSFNSSAEFIVSELKTP